MYVRDFGFGSTPELVHQPVARACEAPADHDVQLRLPRKVASAQPRFNAPLPILTVDLLLD
jgi:hypothetical protein